MEDGGWKIANPSILHLQFSILVFSPHPTTNSASRVVSDIHHKISRGVIRPKNIAAETSTRLDRVIVTVSWLNPTFDNALIVMKSNRSPGISGSAQSNRIWNTITAIT